MALFAPAGGGERPVVAFGPEMPGWGSWEWVGADIAQELCESFKTIHFQGESPPRADAVVVVKHLPSGDWLEQVSAQAPVIYCPIDFYSSSAEIDSDGTTLQHSSRILVHCERLRKYFEPYAPTAYLDHHVKFVADPLGDRCLDGFVLWVGVRTNLPPLIEWINEHTLPRELRILTNLEHPKVPLQPSDLGIRPDRKVRIENWSPELQIRRTTQARLALDIKGQDFRSRHKPPAKALDYIASGLPLAMNPESSPVEHLSRMGFEVASPLNWDHWLSEEYWQETQRFGRAIRELLSLRRIGRRFPGHIDEVLAEHRGTRNRQRYRGIPTRA
jgi:hypothetical protein